MDIWKLINICEQVAADVEKDIKELDGKTFTGKVVAEQFGYHAAAIKALSEVIKEFIKNSEPYDNTIYKS